MGLFQFVHDFLSPEEEAGVKVSTKSGKTNRKFLIIVVCHQIAHMVIQVASILAILSSILEDMEYNDKVINGNLQILERNADDLSDIFGKEAWRRKLSRFSKDQTNFFFSSIAWAALYAVNLGHFFVYNNFRVRVIWAGFFHFIVLVLECFLLYYIFASYFGTHTEVKEVATRLKAYYNSPVVKQRGSRVESFNSLMVKGQPIYAYCFDGDTPEDLRRNVEDNHLCPADGLKMFALIISLIDALLILDCILIVIMWHHSVEEVEEYGEVRVHPESESSSETSSSTTDEGSPQLSMTSIITSYDTAPLRLSADLEPNIDAKDEGRRTSGPPGMTSRKKRMSSLGTRGPRLSIGPEVTISHPAGRISASVMDLRKTLNLS